MLHTVLRALIEEAGRAQGYIPHVPIGFDEPTCMVSKPAAVTKIACLKTENLPSLFDKDGKLLRVPKAAPGATSIRLEAGIITGSRVANAGAHVIIQPEASRVVAVGKIGDIAMETNAGSFRTIEAAEFSTVTDDLDVLPTPFPVSTARIDWTQAIGKGFRIELPRKDRKDVNPDALSAEIVAALILGLARSADEVLLSKVAAALPTAFTLGKAAAQGLKVGELRGLIGTAGAGAAIAQDGALRAAGIASELTPDMVGTIVGAWNRSAVAIHEEVSVHFERLNKNGDLIVTAWAHFVPLVPDASKFWTVSGA